MPKSETGIPLGGGGWGAALIHLYVESVAPRVAGVTHETAPLQSAWSSVIFQVSLWAKLNSNLPSSKRPPGTGRPPSSSGSYAHYRFSL